jgi:membrane-bound serine protease (ClpP class)
VEITAEPFARSLDEARRAGAKIIILSIDSPGGLVAEKERMLQVMSRAKDLDFVAHVRRRAISSAAIIALACPTMVMMPDSSIGATVMFQVGPDGTPRNIEEKWQSALRANDRAASTLLGRRSELWVRGMTEPDLELSIIEDREGMRLVEGAVPEGKLIKGKGRILTVTGTEAEAWGLSRGTVRETAEIRGVLNLPAWHDVGDAPGSIMAAAARGARQEALKREQEAARLKERFKRLDAVRPQVAEIDIRLRELDEQARAATVDLERLQGEAEAELAAIKAELDTAIAQAKVQNSAINAARARADARTRAADVRSRYEPRMKAARDQGAAAVSASLKLVEKRGQLLAGAE